MYLTAEEAERLIDERFRQLAESLLPGGPNQLSALDPDYGTDSLHRKAVLPTNGTTTDHETEIACRPGQSVPFQFVMNNQVANGVYGVSILTPRGIGSRSSGIVFQVINGTTRARALTNDGDFNRPIGRFNTGTLVAFGVVECGRQGGLIKIAYGSPEAEADLGLTTNNARAELITGDAIITLPKAGSYVVTYLVEETLP